MGPRAPRSARSGSPRRAPCAGSGGRTGSSPSFLRRPLTWTSSVLVDPNQLTSHTSSMSRSRLTTVPGLAQSRARRSNSLRVSSSGSPSSVTVRADGSSSMAPMCCKAVRRRGRGGARAAQDRADAGDELAGAERLHDVVVGAELEAQHAVGLVAAGGEHDHRHALVGAQLAQQVEARAVGEHDVEEHEVGALAAGDLEAGRQRAGRLRAEALASEGFRQRNGDGVFVLDEQHHPRLDVHALIVGGLARCGRRFSRPRGDRDRRLRGRCRRGRRRRRSRHGRCCRRRRAPLLSSGPRAAVVVAALAGARPRAAGAVVATAPSAMAMAMAGAVLATRRLRGGRSSWSWSFQHSAHRWRARPRHTGRRHPRWSGRGRPAAACSSSTRLPRPASCRRWPAWRPRPPRGARSPPRPGAGSASVRSGSGRRRRRRGGRRRAAAMVVTGVVAASWSSRPRRARPWWRSRRR